MRPGERITITIEHTGEEATEREPAHQLRVTVLYRCDQVMQMTGTREVATAALQAALPKLTGAK